MEERPILFSGPMVRAILGGRKTQTRRVVKPSANQKRYVKKTWVREPTQSEWNEMAGTAAAVLIGQGDYEHCPYGKPGDRLWVRESFVTINREIVYAAGYQTSRPYLGCKWKPSIHMPRWASRITLEITGIRLERVQDISNEDAFSEGCRAYPDREYWNEDHGGPVVLADTPRDEFKYLWDSINAKRGYGWDKNPWVWAIGFSLV